MSDLAGNGANSPVSPLLGLIRLLPEPCALVDPTGMVSHANAQWEDVFVETGIGQLLVPVVTALFRWEPDLWAPVAQQLKDLLAGELSRVSFDAPLAEPPERWASCTLAAIPGGFIWQLHDVTRWQLAEADASHQLAQFRDAVDSISDGFALYDPDDRLVYCNRRYREIYPACAPLMTPGRSFSAILKLGLQRGQYLDALGDEEAYLARRLAAFRSATSFEEQLSTGAWIRVVDQRTAGGATVAIRSDITAVKTAEALQLQAAQQDALITAQAALVSELSTPLLRISDGVLVLPLIGALDSMRAARVVESLLHAVSEQRARLVILDITGVPVVDTQVANVLIQCARAVRLLGAATVLTGIRPDVAETMVTLGVDLAGVVTRADLQQGVAYALHSSGL